MAVSASDVKKLRDQTGAGMMDCKKALEESSGDLTAAVEYLRVKGQAGAQKRADRATNNGMVAMDVTDGTAVLVELVCETDFVAKSAEFQKLADQVLLAAVTSKAEDVTALLAATVDGVTVESLVADANATIGEKIVVRRMVRISDAHVASYAHRTSPDLPAQIGVVVASDKPADAVRDIAMHAAAMSPSYLNRMDVPEDVVASERRVAEEKSREEGKPEAALPKIIEGRVDAFFRDAVLTEQKFAKDPSRTVQQVANEAGVTLTQYVRFAVGADA